MWRYAVAIDDGCQDVEAICRPNLPVFVRGRFQTPHLELRKVPPAVPSAGVVLPFRWGQAISRQQRHRCYPSSAALFSLDWALQLSLGCLRGLI